MFDKTRMKFREMAAQYAMTGTMPSPPEATLSDIFPDKQAQERLCRIVEEESDEVVRYLLVEWLHTQKEQIVEFCRVHGIDAGRRKFRSHYGYNPDVKAMNLSWLRILGVALAAFLIVLIKDKVVALEGTSTLSLYAEKAMSGLGWGLIAGGLQSVFEGWRYSKTDLLSRAFSWWMGLSRPQIWRDTDKLGEMYLHGHVDVAELNAAVAFARGIKARCSWDRSPRIPIGTTSGLLRAQGVAMSAPLGVPLSITLNDLATSMIILGGTGSGKTMHLNAQITSFLNGKGDESLICIDPKRSSMMDIYSIFSSIPEERRARYKFRVIGPDAWQMAYNPIDRKVMTPEEASSILLDAIKGEGGGQGDGEYWASMTVDLVYSAMHLLDLAGVERDLGTVNDILMNHDAVEATLKLAEDAAVADTEKLELLAKVRESIRVNLLEVPEKTRGNVISSISAWIGRFSMPSMSNFNRSNISLEDLVREQCLFIVDIPETLGKPGKLLRYFLFRQLYDIALKRIGTKDQRYMVLIADEVQESTNAFSFRKSALSREGRLCLIAASQSRSQLVTTWGGKESADTILANFRSRIILSTDDMETREWMKKLISEGELPEHSYSKSTSRTKGMGASPGAMMAGPLAGLFGMMNFNKSKTDSTTWSVNLKRSPLRDEVFDTMGPGQAVCVLNWGGCRRKSIVTLDARRFDKSPRVKELLIKYHQEVTGNA
ncbi:MAG: type IV secretory system conjugative DNA transfer family protein [Syntrophorhabdus sp.]|nr:type IV secretory system conjugative DNA transfer family protein [Syntrophorhabdus sp.]